MRAALLLLNVVLALVAFTADGRSKLAPLPPLLRAVSDAAEVLTLSEGVALSDLLATIERETRTRVNVVILPTVEPEGVESHTQRLIERWRERTRALDNDRFIFVVIAKEDHVLA